MPTDSAPMVIALGEAYTEGDKGLPQNAVAARKWFRVGVRLSAGQSLGASIRFYLDHFLIQSSPDRATQPGGVEITRPANL